MVCAILSALYIPLVKEVVKIEEQIHPKSLVAHNKMTHIIYAQIYQVVIRKFVRLSAVLGISSGVGLKICPITGIVVPAYLNIKFTAFCI